MELIGWAVGIAICYLLGPHVSRILERATDQIKLAPPDGVTKGDWESFIKPEGSDEAGKWLGFFERVLVFFCFYSTAYVVIAGWFTLKVASKWQVWSTVIKMPNELDGKPDNISYLRARQRWGSWLHMRFLLGTIINALVGLILAAALKELVT